MRQRTYKMLFVGRIHPLVAAFWLLLTAVVTLLAIYEAQVQYSRVRLQLTPQEVNYLASRAHKDLRPANVDARLELASSLLEKGDDKGALKEYLRALNLDSNNAAALLGMGLAFERQGRLREAQDALRRCLKISPLFSEARFELGRMLVKTRRYREAEEELTEVLKVEVSSSDTHFWLGKALAGRRKYGEAGKHFLEALRYVPDFREARQALERLPNTKETTGTGR